MGQPTRRESYSGPLMPTAFYKDRHYHHHHHYHHSYSHDQRLFEFADKEEANKLVSPFGKLERLSLDDIRETAYEIFFTACRSTPGFGGRNAHLFHSNNNQNESKPSQVVMSPTSRVKKALGLKMLKRSPSRRMTSAGNGGGPSSPVGGGSPYHHSMLMSRPRRPMTSAEIMRQQMKVTEHNDNRLRKIVMRTLVGQAGKRAETIILPLELLRHLKPSEFSDSHEHHMWQKRQLKVLELGLLIHPSIPVEKNNTFAARLRDIIRSCELKPLDTGKNSDTLRTLCNSVVSLAWRGPNGTPTDFCHWADGFPLNIHFYNSLLHAVFDIRDETLVLDEVDELLELIKKTWSILGITRSIHNVCFSWVLFQQYVATGQVESDLLCASHVMLSEVANDAKKEKESSYLKLLASVLTSMQSWGEKRLLDYHEFFPRGTTFQMESLLPLVLLVSNILGEDLVISDKEGREKGDVTIVDSSGDRVDLYIRSSMKNAFDKVIEAVNAKYAEMQIKGELSAILLHLAQETEDLAIKERQSFSPILKKWHPAAASVAALMLHSCYGHVLRQYLSDVTSLTSEAVEVLQRAGKLEKVLVQMVVEDSHEDDDDNRKTVVKDMVPYEVDSVILNLLRKWIDESLYKGRECLQRAKETETWNPKSKSELYAQSAAELANSTKTMVEEFFQIPIGITDELVQELADGLESLIQDYMIFVAACGSKQSYIPVLPPLTRCSRDSTITKLWKRATPCGTNLTELDHITGTNEGHNPRPSTSRGTQRLYIRLNTLHYLLAHVHSLEKSLSQIPGLVPSTRHCFTNNLKTQSSKSGTYFETLKSAIPAALQHVSEVAAYRLIFLDSNSVFYDSLYVEDVGNSRIRPALRILKQNLTLMTTLLLDRAQPMAMKEVMRTSFDAFLMVLLAGGSSRVFNRSDHVMIQEDFESLIKVFCTCGEGLVSENVVEREAAVVEGVIGLMGQYTEQLMEDFSIAACETSGIGVMCNNGQKLPMPPTTGRWHRSDPNTILRVLCHRNDRTANYFLKRTFQLGKRR